MKTKKIIKIIVDTAMLILLPLLMAYSLIGETTHEWLAMGMSMGSASAFMITGPATKITNLGALKIVLGMKRFLMYLAFAMAFSLVTGLIVNIII